MSKAVDSPTTNDGDNNGLFNRFLATVEFLGNMLPTQSHSLQCFVWQLLFLAVLQIGLD